MKYRLLCVDLDGTLLTDDKEIRDEDVEALRRAEAQGIRIALVTGRMPAATDRIVSRLGIPCILACNAGTYILEEEQCIHTEYLPTETMQELYGQIRSFGIPLWIFREKRWYVTGKDQFVEEEERIIDYRVEVVRAEELALQWRRDNTGPNKLLIGAGPQVVQEIQGTLRNRRDVDVACSSPNYLEIFPRGANKGKALRLICENAGISKEETIAFGDQELDIPMLEAAGTAVAMGNAIEELKRKADYVTKTNNEAGIACALKNFIHV